MAVGQRERRRKSEGDMEWAKKNRWVIRDEKITKWHTWFAWYPVLMGYSDETHSWKMVWLKKIERLGIFWGDTMGSGYTFKYRELNNGNKK